MTRPAWLTHGVIAAILLVAAVVLLFGVINLRGCSLARQERAIDAGKSAALGAQGAATTADTVRAAQEALATQRAADAAADNEARHDETAATELPASVRARIAASDKRLCAKANCD